MKNKLSHIIATIQPLVDAIKHHKILTAVTSIEKLRVFTQIHVYAVWDFMCLLKALQRKLTSTQLLWLPPLNHLGCHLVNALLMEEESDDLPNNGYLSHFELYLESMKQCGANTRPIENFIADIREEKPLSVLLDRNDLPVPAKRFIIDTFEIIEKESHIVAASLALAREHITSDMFSTLLHSIKIKESKNYLLQSFFHYLQRHIDLDSGKHSCQSQILVTSLCGTDEKKWEEVMDAAVFSLKSRLQLLDGIYQQVSYDQ